MTNPTAVGMRAAGNDATRISASNLAKFFITDGQRNYALKDISLDIGAGEMVVLLGPSGCGKTTLLRSIAGLEVPQQGQIHINGALMYSAEQDIYVPPERRNVSMVFQSYALWPHMTVRQIIAFPLAARKVPASQQNARVGEIAEVVNLTPFLDRYPNQLSGGQQQRVALARAIVAGTDVILFDEPLSNVDAKVREQIRREISALQRRFGFSGLYVTHDQAEASAIADRLVVMDHGIVVQTGAPEAIYRNPANEYVATFMGQANLIRGVLQGIDAGLARVSTPLGELWAVPRSELTAGSAVNILFRPESCKPSASEPISQPNTFRGVIKDTAFLGPLVETTLEVSAASGRQDMAVVSPTALGAAGGSIWFSFAPGDAWAFSC